MARKKVRNRNVGIRQVKAGALIAHPMNWRRHSAAQAGALKGILEEVGFVGTLLARETPEGLQLIDGHLRAETLPHDEVDVMVVDLNDEEVALILATHDTLGTMAEADANILDQLLAEITIASGEISSMLSGYIDQIGHADPEPRKRGAGGVSHEEAEYPLVPVFNEKYEYVILFAKNATEWGALQTLLHLKREKSYKSSGVGVGRVIPAPKFFELWENAHVPPDRLPNP